MHENNARLDSFIRLLACLAEFAGYRFSGVDTAEAGRAQPGYGSRDFSHVAHSPRGDRDARYARRWIRCTGTRAGAAVRALIHVEALPQYPSLK
jgi:hypothetical protein